MSSTTLISRVFDVTERVDRLEATVTRLETCLGMLVDELTRVAEESAAQATDETTKAPTP